MRVLFCPHRHAQHLYPMVPLAWAFRTAGHEVRVAGVPELADAIVHTGLPAVLVGKDKPVSPSAAEVGAAIVHQRGFPADWPLYQHLLNAEQREAIEVLGRNSAAAAESTVDDLISYAGRWRPDLIVHDIAGFAGAVAAAALGVPNVRYLTGVGLRPMENRVGTNEPLPEYAQLFERRGLDVRIATITVDPSPPSLRLPVPEPYIEARYVPYNGRGSLPAWLERDSGRPRICLTWGLSVARLVGKIGPAALDPFRDTVSALAELDAELVLTTTADQLEQLGELPDNVRPLVSVPLHLLLPHCAVIVHQAGDGTALTATALGIPQLAISRKPDPALTGSRLATAGAAIHLRYQDLEGNPDAHKIIRGAVEDLLGDRRYTEAAARLRAEIDRQPTPAALVPILADLARGG
jgi:glycosyltransferase